MYLGDIYIKLGYIKGYFISEIVNEKDLFIRKGGGEKKIFLNNFNRGIFLKRFKFICRVWIVKVKKLIKN